MTAKVWRLTEFHTRTWGCKNPQKCKITITAAERNILFIIQCSYIMWAKIHDVIIWSTLSKTAISTHAPLSTVISLWVFWSFKILHDAVWYQFLWTSFMLTPSSAKHCSLVPTTSPLKVFVTMTPAVQLTGCLSIHLVWYHVEWPDWTIYRVLYVCLIIRIS